MRQDRWQKFYESIERSFHGTWELILVGPYKPLFEKSNMIWIEDWSHPVRCQQRGLLAAQGDYVTFSWDDAIYHEDMLDKAWDILKEHNFHSKIAVISKFLEGEVKHDWAFDDNFSLIGTHIGAQARGIPDTFLIQNTGMTSRKEIMELGGCDCRFQIMALGVLDLSVRLQANGVKMVMQQGCVLDCTWEIGGEHRIIEDTYTMYDKPLYKHKYHKDLTDIHVDPENWKKAPDVWKKRFKQ